VELSVVVPYFNPGEALQRTVHRLIKVLTAAGHAFEIIAVCDGSTDGSAQRLAAIGDLRLRQLAHERNRGKGAALRTGFAGARGRYIGFIDGDGDLDPAVLPAIRNTAALGGLDAVIGAKQYANPLGARRESARRMFSAGYRALVRFLFSLTVRDTQTGVKLFRREALAAVLPRCRQDRYAIDLELLAWMHRLGYRRVLEVPVALERRGRSTITLSSVVKLLTDTLALRAWLIGFSLGWVGATGAHRAGAARRAERFADESGAASSQTTAVPVFGEPAAVSLVGVLPAGRIPALPRMWAGTG
jgi:glycosyltransferase involved in cell wall biosynthesis